MSEGVCRSGFARRNENDTPPELLIAQWAAEQHGVITLAQLHACGLDRAAVLRRVRAGTLHPVHRGVYAVGHPALTRTGRFVAAVLACGDGAALSWFACGSYWGFMRWEERLIDVTVPGTTTRRIAGVRVHRARSFDERDVWKRDGMRVTSPARTLLDLAAVLPPAALRRAARQAQADRHVNVCVLTDVLRRSNGHRGVGALRAIVADGPAPTRSELEDLLLDLLDATGIPRPEINSPLQLDGRRIVPDYLWRERRIAIEADGRRWHDDPLTRQNDADKQAILEAHGYRVIRIDHQQIVERPAQTAARIAAALDG